MEASTIFRRLLAELGDRRSIVDAVTCWLVLAVNFLVPGRLFKPHARHFSQHDASLAQPHKGDELVGDTLLVAVMLFLPLCVFVLFQFRARSLLDVKVAFLSVSESITVASTFARWLKLSGRYRPDFLERLALGGDHLVVDGSTSFPSEHTTYAFASMVVVFWYLAGKLHIFESSRVSFPKACIAVTPLGLAAGIGVSRTIDNLHHFSDIVAGAGIGCFCGMFAYFINYPTPFHPQCHLCKREMDRAGEAAKRD